MRAAVAIVAVVVVVGLPVAAAARVYTRTTAVADVALAHGGRIAWVATAGGVERYDLARNVRTRVFTTDDGLAVSAVQSMIVVAGLPVARTATAACMLWPTGRFVCTAAPALHPSLPVGDRFADSRITARAALADDSVLIGTATAGLWRVASDGDAKKLTPDGQICSNQIVAITSWQAGLWLGSFDDGVCVFDGQRFTTPHVPFRMVNDMVATRAGLIVAAGEGLFVTRDGTTWKAVRGVRDRGFNGLALDGDTLLATTPGGLFEISLVGRGAPRLVKTTWMPGTSRSLQGVAVRDGVRWLTSEDRGVVRLGDAASAATDSERIYDRAAGMPSSWSLKVALPAGAAPCTLMATLRDGLVRIGSDGRGEIVRGTENAWLLFVGLDPDGATAWVGAQGGLFRVAPGGIAEKLAAPPEDNVHVVRRVGATLWIGTEGGLEARALS